MFNPRSPAQVRHDRVRGAALLGAIALALAASPSLARPTPVAATAPLALKAGRVTVFRDRWGMAHIYAAREADGFFGLGYATAEDRLEQVLLQYVGVKGELAAAFGPGAVGADQVGPVMGGEITDTVASDLRVRRYRILEEARRTMPNLPAGYREDLKAYVAGLAQYMADHPQRKPGWAPKLEPALALALFWQYTLEADMICPARLAGEAHIALVEPNPLVASKASDAFAIGRSRTADGGVTLSSDSHHPWEGVGTIFYPWRMKAGSLDFQAFDMPGAPMFLFGHSRDFAWGWTEGPRYTGDCYRVQTDKADPKTFLFDGKPQRMTETPYRIDVRGAAPVTGTFEYTHHNGVLSPVVQRDGDQALVVSSAYFDHVGVGNGELYQMAHAHTRTALTAALAPMALYPANLILAGRDGLLLYIRPGRLPKRPVGVDVTRPLDGSTSKTAWVGFVSLSEALKVQNPPQDYIGNDNVSPDRMYAQPMLKPSDYRDYYAFDPGQTNTRQLRMIDLLEGAKGVTDARAIDITMDQTIVGVDRWSAMFKTLEQPDPARAADPEQASFIAVLAHFDGEFTKESRGALYHKAFRRALRAGTEEGASGVEAAVESGRPLSASQRQVVEDAVTAARKTLRTAFGTIDLVFGDVYRIGRGGGSFPVGGATLPWFKRESGLNTVGARTQSRRTDEAMRTMDFQPDPKTPGLQDAYCCQRVPFVVTFHPDGSLTSYSEALPGVSDDPASPHFGDQMRLASENKLRSNDFDLRALQADTESRVDIVVTRREVRAKDQVNPR